MCAAQRIGADISDDGKRRWQAVSRPSIEGDGCLVELIGRSLWRKQGTRETVRSVVCTAGGRQTRQGTARNARSEVRRGDGGARVRSDYKDARKDGGGVCLGVCVCEVSGWLRLKRTAQGENVLCKTAVSAGTRILHVWRWSKE